MKSNKKLSMLFLFLLSAGLISAKQAPVTDLVIQLAENHNDIILNWTRPFNADSFCVYSGDSSDFYISIESLIGTTTDTTFTHANAITSADKKFYAVAMALSDDIEGMVLVPAGSFEMGANFQIEGQPIHTVTVPAFYIDVYEVTNAQYKVFCDATIRAYPEDPGFGIPDYFTNLIYADYPVVSVNWNDASAYAAWAGKRLPSEAEWERAAKGDVDNRQWPWGDTWVEANANVRDNPADGYVFPAPVGTYPNGISPEGCYDMSGNVWEWCEDDWHYDYNGAPSDGSAWISEPRGTDRILRGGSWNNIEWYARSSFRHYYNLLNSIGCVGFRCAMSMPDLPPNAPENPFPDNGAIDQSENVNLSWTCSDPNLDPLTYDVYFGTASTPPLVNSGQTAAIFNLGLLTEGTTYFWQIVAHDDHGDSTIGPVWSFSTMVAPDDMVLILPYTFNMGADYQAPYSLPIHAVCVPAFYMDIYEVTNAQYKSFCDATSYPYPPDPYFFTDYFTDPIYADYPVVNVYWNDAHAYATWVGKRLPTEAEWELAAKGPTDNRIWPWSDTWNDAYANVRENADDYEFTAPVGSFPNGISPTGCFDMAGNVSEWCEDDNHNDYNGAPTDGSAWIDSPRGSNSIVRGGSWFEPADESNCGYRKSFNHAGRSRIYYIGFRCAKSLDSQPPQIPSAPIPADGAFNQSTDVNLSWTCSDPELDPLTYDVYFGTSSAPPLVSSGQPIATFDPGTLADATVYFWQIVTYDDHGNSRQGPVWHFSTNQPPSVPNNPLPGDFANWQLLNVDLSWTCSDPDLDPLTYDVYFGTSSTPPLVSSGQSAAIYDPGTLVNGTTYYWQIVAFDNHEHSTPGPVWSFTSEVPGMVLVPEGPYQMGADYQLSFSLPIHTVTVPAFYIDIYEVTNAQYKAFCDATSRRYPPDPGFSMPNYFTSATYASYPVVDVTWNDAVAYAAWVGKRLPTEAEWERAAKGNTDNRQWPYGDSWIAANANICDNPADGYTYTSPVGNYPGGISPGGCYDMAGNVWEWCEDDWHSSYTGAPSNGSAWVDNPRGSYRIYRGGSWNDFSPTSRCAYRGRYVPADLSGRIGFRCARTP